RAGSGGDPVGDDPRELTRVERAKLIEGLDRGAERDESHVPRDGVDGHGEKMCIRLEQFAHDLEPLFGRVLTSRGRAVATEDRHDAEHLAKAGAHALDYARDLVAERQIVRDA